MNIIIAIAHPAHVHYFKNIAEILQNKKHKIMFFVRDRECIIDLIEQTGFDYISYGKGGNSLFSKLFGTLEIDTKLLKLSLQFKPDLFLSQGAFYTGHVGSLLKKPVVALRDTEHAKLGVITDPFASMIFSPYVWFAKIKSNQILLKYFQELLYLHKKYFSPDNKIVSTLKINENEKYVIIRFIAWNAYHDVGSMGLNFNDKIRIVEELAKKYKVFISSESELPIELEQYRLQTHPSQFHSVMNYATLCISEGSTTASESAILGTPTIYVNPLHVSYCDEEERNGLLYQSTDVDKVILKAKEILQTPNVKEVYQERKDKFLSEMIDGTSFLTWFIENYPESKKIMKENPDYQYRFK